MNIIPGEPVPPGFEDEVNREAEIQKFIETYKLKSLIGLEYTVELHEDDRREPGYLCTMCDKRGDPRTIVAHWTSLNHRLKYLERHYPTAMREFNPVRYKPNSNSVMLSIVKTLADAIEQHHGRLKLSVYNADEFRRLKTKIVNEISGNFHFGEHSGPNFANLVDTSLCQSPVSSPAGKKLEHTLQITIKAPKRLLQNPSPPPELGEKRDELDEISSEEDEQEGNAHKKAKKSEHLGAIRLLPRVRRSPPFEENREKDKEHECKKLPTPRELSLQASHIAQERFKWEKYRCMLEIQLKQMQKLQQDYEKNPEKHPLYPEEWKKFWNRRYKELQAEKKVDPNKYDYKPEWIKFWTQRMKEIFSADCEKKKIEIKAKLGLPEDAVEKYVDQLKEKYKVKVSRNATSGADGGAGKAHLLERSRKTPISGTGHGRDRKRDKATGDVIAISDDDDNSTHRDDISLSRSRSPTPSYSRRSRSGSNSLRHSRPQKRSRAYSRSRSGSRLPTNDYERLHRGHHRSGAPATATSSRAYPPMETDFYGGGGGPSATFSRQRYPYVGGAGGTGVPYRIMDSHKYPYYERSPSDNSKSANAREEETVATAEPEDDSPLTVVAVLRLLTALEDQLGSMGPKAVDMLGKALALEKLKANSADDMLLNDDNCVFFETIKEKLKGLLIAEVLDDVHKVRAVKKAIKNIAAVMHQVNEGGKKAQAVREEAMAAVAAEANAGGGGSGGGDASSAPKASAVPTVKDLPFDRQVVSSKLAAALIMEGREDITTVEMDKLIFMFVLMVKMSKTKRDGGGEALSVRDILPTVGITPLAKLPSAAALATLPAIVDELLEHEVSALVEQVQEDLSAAAAAEREPKIDTSTGSMLESLTDSDLQTLLQNFKHLSREEQHHLIAHLKKLESADPVRVEKLRKFVNVNDFNDVASTSKGNSTGRNSNASDKNEPSSSKRYMGTRRFNNNTPPPGSETVRLSDDEDMCERRRGVNVANPNKFSLDDEDEDDDYNFDDVFKAASSNVNRLAQERNSKLSTEASGSKAGGQPILPVTSSPSALTFNPAGLNISLTDTQNLIANLMGSLQQSNANSSNKASKNTLSSHAQTGTANAAASHAHTLAQSQTKTPYYQHNQSQQQAHLQHQQQQQQHTQNPYGHVSYNQMGNAQPSAYYNAMGGGYNNGTYSSYQQWTNSQQMPTMQQYGMQQNYMQQPQQQQQTHHHSQMGYSMYGRGGN